MSSHRFRRSRQFLLSPYKWKVRLVFWIGALLVGLLSALFAAAADWAITLFHHVPGYSPYLPLLITPCGLMLVAWLTQRYFRGSEGSGIPQVIAVLEVGRVPALEKALARLMTLRIALGKILMTLLGLLAGASIGREGPTVHVGAALMQSLGQKAGLPAGRHLRRGLILAGSAAGLAAAFNTPLAGIVFAIEEMSRSFDRRINEFVLTAVIFAATMAVALLGNYAYFGHTAATLDLSGAWLLIPLCGALGGFLGGTFSLLLFKASTWIAPWLRSKPIMVAGLCGLVLALIGLASGGATYGTGYETAKAALQTGSADPLFPVLKFAATIVSYVSGIPGGIFAPSLSIGAVLGGLLADVSSAVPPETLVLLTMAAYFAGVVQTPITALVVVLEMTHGQNLAIPMMAVTFIAGGISRLVCPTPIYTALAKNFLRGTAATTDKTRTHSEDRPATAAGRTETGR